MANDRKDQDGISRRDFATRVGAAAAGMVVAGDIFGPFASAAGDAVLILAIVCHGDLPDASGRKRARTAQCSTAPSGYSLER